jgi:CRP/FNR family nitrogen fixation transcriptional regulator
MHAHALRRPGGLPDALLAGREAGHVLDRFESFGCSPIVGRAQTICERGEPAEFCWRIRSGCVRTVEWLGGGRRHVGAFLWEGDFVGIDAQTHHADAEAVTPVALRRYRRRTIEAAAESDAALALWLRKTTAEALAVARDHIALLGRKTAMGKTASFLLALDRRSTLPSGNFVALPMSRTDIADHLGLSVETVCRNLVHLQRDGAVRLVRSGVELCDRVALLQWALE